MNAEMFEQQLDAVLKEFNAFSAKSEVSDLSDLPKVDRQALVTKAIAAIHRITGNNSIYAKEVDRLLKSLNQLHMHTTSILGVVKALRDDLKAGYFRSLVELVHSDVFADFLEMAEHLCEAAYKDAAAVVAGSTLESHLRSLCQKAEIPVEIAKADGSVVPKKAEAMNSDLASGGTYTKLDQKSVTAWLDLRNKAAHGKYDEYSQEQVSVLVSGVRDFIVRNPA
ncbi:MAG: hypothetical protein M0Q22_00600 [Sulfuritalea sp.]|jgi:hypothetical protein|nr:hypothetical protein [Sulfuritalea sp.]